MTEPAATTASQATRAAIELLTMWISEGDDEAREEQSQYIGRRVSGLSETDRLHLIRGQLYLNELLLLSIAEANGANDIETLQAGALQWLREFALEIAE
ncbi:hypothetical protein ACFROC_01705 [Nocardia tengchongensis]|uniref:hypothetical protein n=1 Tax=Nocardia tengchongensis TaxID=2055889 RepID=UPI0036A0B2EA